MEVLRARSRTQGDMLARLRVRLCYAFRHRRLPNLDHPTRYTELVQKRKLTERDPMLPRLTDKLLVKEHVASELGEAWITPTLWQGTRLPARREWPQPIVVKSRHGCNQRVFVRTADHDWRTFRRKATRWMQRRYGYWLDEWAYEDIERGILVEPFIGLDGELPVDYKLHVFNGSVEYVQVHLDRERNHRWMLFDRNWQRVSAPRGAAPTQPPSLPAMIEAAEHLGRRFDHVRIDFYDVEGRARFGEMTFYPGSGLDPFDPPALDSRLGAQWLAVGSAHR